ncbi:hypothetical protein [Myceligenerans crystallogenes]|uniref:SipW-cognate class signal peptide n=1 Tax=Myceligenerans crystallogenes TaxID=316335 RepID=A0ABN2N254_9MICO
MRRVPRWLKAILVLAGLSAGTWLVTVVPQIAFVEDSFEVEGAVGETVDVEYAEVTVTGVRLAEALYATSGAVAGGVFVVVDAEWHARDGHLAIGGAELVDAQDRSHQATSRGGCPIGAGADPAFPMRVTYCFDVSQDLLDDGLVLRLGRGGDGEEGSYQRRDAVAVVDLGPLGEAPVEGTAEKPMTIRLPGPADPAATQEGTA